MLNNFSWKSRHVSMLKNVLELDRPEWRIKYGAKKDAIFARTHTHTNNV